MLEFFWNKFFVFCFEKNVRNYLKENLEIFLKKLENFYEKV